MSSSTSAVDSMPRYINKTVVGPHLWQKKLSFLKNCPFWPIFQLWTGLQITGGARIFLNDPSTNYPWFFNLTDPLLPEKNAKTGQKLASFSPKMYPYTLEHCDFGSNGPIFHCWHKVELKPVISKCAPPFRPNIEPYYIINRPGFTTKPYFSTSIVDSFLIN